MSDHYILGGPNGRTPIHVDDVLEWAEFFEKANRIVEQTKVGDRFVSTVFLGLNHRFGKGPPLIFETMVFGPPERETIFGRDRLIGDEEYCERCSTWEEAEIQHALAVEKTKERLGLSISVAPKRAIDLGEEPT